MKRCRHCDEVKPLSEFSTHKGSPDGYHWWCKECNRAAARARYAKAPETQRARSRTAMRRRRAADPEGERAYIVAWRGRNADRVRACDARRRQSPERRAWQAAYWREWKRRNPEAVKAIARRGQLNRRARLMQAFLEKVEPLVVLERHEGLCGICGEPVDPERFDVDHIVPLARGGEHSYANTQPAHPTCNTRKGARLPEELAA